MRLGREVAALGHLLGGAPPFLDLVPQAPCRFLGDLCTLLAGGIHQGGDTVSPSQEGLAEVEEHGIEVHAVAVTDR